MQPNVTLVWRAESWPGTECFTLHDTLDGQLAEGYCVGNFNGTPYAVAYKIELTSDWRVKHFGVFSLMDVHKKLRFTTDLNGHWFNDEREQDFTFDGCDYIDISLTPFTNTLPIKRLQFPDDSPQPIDVMYVDIPSFTVHRTQQFYSKISDATYRFQDADRYGYKADFTVDPSGFVLDYPQVFQRV